MVSPQHIAELLNPRKNRLLLYAQAALPEKQFVAFRKLLLDELGNSGLIGDLEALLGKVQDANSRQGTGRNTYAGKEVDRV